MKKFPFIVGDGMADRTSEIRSFTVTKQESTTASAW